MLSKVLGRGTSNEAREARFPQLEGYLPRGDTRGSSDDPDEGTERKPDNSERDSLRERVRQLEQQLVVERREAFEKGKEQGEQQGRQEGEQRARTELQPVIERLNASITQTVGLRPDLRRRAERDVVKLALLIARRILHRQLSVDEEALSALARVAFERLTRSESYRVTVHPQFAAAVASVLPGSHASRVKIEPDPACALGTLIVHSSEGTIDASIDAQLEEIGRGLTDRIHGVD